MTIAALGQLFGVFIGTGQHRSQIRAGFPADQITGARQLLTEHPDHLQQMFTLDLIPQTDAHHRQWCELSYCPPTLQCQHVPKPVFRGYSRIGIKRQYRFLRMGYSRCHTAIAQHEQQRGRTCQQHQLQHHHTGTVLATRDQSQCQHIEQQQQHYKMTAASQLLNEHRVHVQISFYPV
jgi:hypothetical protein